MSGIHEKAASAPFTVAIIGGGFTGATLAVQLLERSGETVSVILVDRGPRIARGAAYATDCAEHLLNVRTRNMSAYAGDPEHFLRWARSHHDPGVMADDYLPRQLYGRYLEFVLLQAMEAHPGRIERVEDEAVSWVASGGRGEILLRSGRTLLADKVVLALGNFPPADLRLTGKARCPRYIADPWAAHALDTAAWEQLSADRGVLLIGSGLTSVDVAIALRARGFRGTIHLLSRRGLMPQAHQARLSWPPFLEAGAEPNVRALVRLVRAEVDAAQKRGVGWGAVIDSIRPFTQAIWRSLPRQEQRRFIRHVRPYWEVHRHRIAPQIGALLGSLEDTDQLHIHAGRITLYREDPDGVELTYRNRTTGGLESLNVAYVFNCTGPELDCRKSGSLLLTSLLDQGAIRPDPLYLGLDASENGALINAAGEISGLLYTIGPSRRGSLWETTAVPELRIQVSDMVSDLLTGREKPGAGSRRRESAMA